MLGTAVRLLLHSEGVLRGDDFLDPVRVGEALRRFCETRAVDLPAGAEEALTLAHRIALIGDRGISTLRLDVRANLDVGRLLSTVQTLCTTLASLVASLIGYTGPVFAGIASDHTSSLVHKPLKKVDPQERLSDEQAASAVFIARAG